MFLILHQGSSGLKIETPPPANNHILISWGILPQNAK